MYPRLMIQRILNVFNNLWQEMEYTYNDDIAVIRHEAPLRRIILSAEEPIQMSPGVYVFKGTSLDERRERRYYGAVAGDRVILELWR